jgi:hypothetical protein
MSHHWNKPALWVATKPKAPSAGIKIGAAMVMLCHCALLLHH